jgi:HSP20 family protein
MPSTKLPRRAQTYAQPRTAFRPIEEMRSNLDRFLGMPLSRFFEESFPADPFAQSVGVIPAIEVAENAKEFTVTAELPGMKQGDIHVEFEEGMLTIRGEKREERKEGDEDKRYLLWERSYGAFRRSFALPSAVDGAKVAAQFDDGVLTVHLPKATGTAARGREIEIGSKK